VARRSGQNEVAGASGARVLQCLAARAAGRGARGAAARGAGAAHAAGDGARRWVHAQQAKETRRGGGRERLRCQRAIETRAHTHATARCVRAPVLYSCAQAAEDGRAPPGAARRRPNGTVSSESAPFTHLPTSRSTTPRGSMHALEEKAAALSSRSALYAESRRARSRLLTSARTRGRSRRTRVSAPLATRRCQSGAKARSCGSECRAARMRRVSAYGTCGWAARSLA
jgi:hypothetical protein